MTYDCIQPNGEHLPVEKWVYDGVMNGTVTDPMLVRVVKGAVQINFGLTYEGRYRHEVSL